MDLTGILVRTAGNLIILEVDNGAQELFNLFEKCPKLKITVDKYRQKRSLDANRYMWKIMTEMSYILRTSPEEVYDLMLQKYGTNALDSEGDIILVPLPSKATFQNVDIHCAYYDTVYQDGGEVNRYRLINGSSLYNTLEMSRLIDGIVSEAQDLGIQTATPDELRMMKERWGV